MPTSLATWRSERATRLLSSQRSSAASRIARRVRSLRSPRVPGGSPGARSWPSIVGPGAGRGVVDRPARREDGAHEGPPEQGRDPQGRRPGRRAGGGDHRGPGDHDRHRRGHGRRRGRWAASPPRSSRSATPPARRRTRTGTRPNRSTAGSPPSGTTPRPPPASQPSGPSAAKSQWARQGRVFAEPRSGPCPLGPPGSSGGCRSPPRNGRRTPARDTSVNRAGAIGRRSADAAHSVRDSGPVWLVSRVKSHRPLGIAHSSRPPAIEAGESTQMSVISTRASADRPRDQQLGVGQRAARLVVHERGAVEPVRPSRRPPGRRNSDSHSWPTSGQGAAG